MFREFTMAALADVANLPGHSVTVTPPDIRILSGRQARSLRDNFGDPVLGPESGGAAHVEVGNPGERNYIAVDLPTVLAKDELEAPEAGRGFMVKHVAP